jgi:uncharacterized DUF497 family protein
VKLRLVITDRVQEKLTEKHNVTRSEIAQCFANKLGRSLEDDREDHRTDPPTRWFLAETDSGRLLKVVYVQEKDVVFIKTTYPPNEEEVRIYNKNAF